jgi:predicted anti-sigma-YlaC factor YlaD
LQSFPEKNVDCTRAAGAIEDMGDGKVGRLRWMLLRRHVKECDECGSYLDRMTAVVEALAGVERLQAPEDLLELVMSSLAQLAAVRSEEPHGHVRRNLLLAAAAGAGVAAVGVAVARRALGREAEVEVAVAGPA